MFYELEEQMDKVLRLGDVVRGYISLSAKIKQPFLSFESSIYHNYDVSFEVPRYSVILTPCCSIGDQMICLTQLIPLLSSFFKNPYFVQDLTRINREIEPEKAIPPDEWEQLPDGKKQEIKAKSKSYALLNYFVYEPSDMFPSYERRLQTTNYYMIDFRNIQTLKCELIKSRDKIGEEEVPILESKCLQLSNQSREELRKKLSFYYGRPSEEEEILED